MKKIIKRIALGILGLIAAIVIGLFIHNAFLTAKYKEPYKQALLSEKEIREMQFISDVKLHAGEKIWPGFENADIPILFFNDEYEFLFTNSVPDSSWEKSENQIVIEKTMYRRNAENPQAFAVWVGSQWAGSIGICDQMNRDMIFGIRSQTPPVLSHLIPFFLITVSPDMHVSGTLHEMFHAYQAKCNEEKFLAAEDAHAVFQNYPFGDSLFAYHWSREGYYLEKALYAADSKELAVYVDSFLITRTLRRQISNLSPEAIEAEKKLEWLEGIAKYAESKAYMLASSMESDYKFKQKQGYWEIERKQQLPKLGRLGGDNRFYHSGAAQAFILDRLNPGWKLQMMEDSMYLEDLFHGKYSCL